MNIYYKVRKSIVFVFIFIGIFSSQGQDIHFSQFYNAFQYLNPAETGNFYGKYRFAYHFRDQWRAVGSPFTTNMASAEGNIFTTKDAFSWGVYFLDDRAGNPTIQHNRLAASLAYHKKIGIHHVHLGIQSTGIYKQLDVQAGTYPSQYNRNTGNFDATLPNNEKIEYSPALYANINGGAVYEVTLGKFDLRAGWAAYHLNSPTESFYGFNNELNMRSVYDVRVGFQINSKTRLSGLVYQTYLSKANELIYALLAETFFYNFGVTKHLKLLGGVSFRDGFFRNRDAFILIGGLRKNNMKATLSYDINVSNLELATDYRGAMEVSVIYEIPVKSTKIKYIPCERY